MDTASAGARWDLNRPGGVERRETPHASGGGAVLARRGRVCGGSRRRGKNRREECIFCIFRNVRDCHLRDGVLSPSLKAW